MNQIGCCKSICPHLPQAQSKVEIEEGTFSAVRAYEARSSKAAPEGSGPTGNAAEVWVWGLGGFGVSKKCTCLPASHPTLLRPAQNKLHMKRFMDGVLAKSTKLKTLQKDLKTNYSAESNAQ